MHHHIPSQVPVRYLPRNRTMDMVAGGLFVVGLIAFVIANLISLPIGVYSALRQDTASDYLVRSFAIMCMAVPSFWLGTMIVVFPSLWWGYSPPIMYAKLTEDLFENLEMFVVPAIVLGLAIAVVWYGFKMLGRLDQLSKASAKGTAKRDGTGDGSIETVACTVCGTFVPAGGGAACGRKDCPYAASAAD